MQMQMPGNHNDIEKRLWDSADQLRANSGLKSSEYSMPVLGLIFLALPAFVWVEVETSTVEIDGRLEMLGIAEAAGGLLDPLDDGVDALEPGIGEPMTEVGEQVWQMALDQLGDGRHGLEAAMSGSPVPAREECLGRPSVAVG